MDGTLRERLIRRNTAEQRALDADQARGTAEAFWRAELTGLGDRIARAILADPQFAGDDTDGGAWAGELAARIARRVAAEACVTLPDHSITGGPEPAPGRHRVTG